MAESNNLDLTPEIIDVFYTHGDKRRLRSEVGEFVLDLERLSQIVDDIDDAVVEYQDREGRPAPNPLRVMITPDQFLVEDAELGRAIDEIGFEPPGKEYQDQI